MNYLVVKPYPACQMAGRMIEVFPLAQANPVAAMNESRARLMSALLK
ncbi:TPA: hypothetical protein MXU87_001120 [Klebsiella quasipneumoniae]|nr:hypothetical protein [Klebsiella quasipneumoniae]